MRDTLIDLYRHQAWADAELWRACESHPGALADRALWERQHHIHLVQQAFLYIVRGLDPHAQKFSRPGDYSSPAELKDEARRYHDDVHHFLDGVDGEALERTIVIPWFKEPPIALAMREALMQSALHSHYHRGQQATRLRELGGTPPTLDYIFWIWKGRVQAEWS